MLGEAKCRRSEEVDQCRMWPTLAVTEVHWSWDWYAVDV